MGYKQIRKEKPQIFERLTGVQPDIFEKMVEVLRQAQRQRKARGGKPNRLSVEEQLLMALEYWREYRTYFHIAKSRGISESACYRNICWVENTLIKDPQFHLPGKKVLREEKAPAYVVIDITESPIQRPKKNNVVTTLERKNAIPIKAKSSVMIRGAKPSVSQ